ncbi:ATPase AAA [Candidatus Methylomirabilis lanthanidiphila]|uniref:ATPase AAA n=1 Tax=Candidatus Methylomirabilis lanthanidiphila TaxID=2211376 RepID=A0A564ZKI9_9BACT|nr:ATP-dependent RecD-like DNA helicase [Candidatus Methylomirabilis lanthanidiphila]VUZ85841.1 ATPase AAA [Candidatus Methylomirabilis lanthanidiphila]
MPARSYDTLQGTLERITYVNEENHYVVARLQVSGRRDLATIVGNLPTVTPGETLKLTGEWVQHNRYGEQFKVETFETITPATLAGIEKYLGSGLIKGIGPVFAGRLVVAFGIDTLRIIEEEPSRLLAVDGIGEVRLLRIRTAWEEQKEIREVMIFLQGHGVSSAYAAKIFKTYGKSSIAIVQENPYRLAKDIYGIGFKTADRIAQAIGIEADSPLRVEAGVIHVLNELAGEGHVFYPLDGLTKASAGILEVDEDLVTQAVERLRGEARVICEPAPQGMAVYLAPLYAAEEGVARRLLALAEGGSLPTDIDIERAIVWVEQSNRLQLAAQQQEAIRQAIQEKLLVITGGPGTGKTTILRCILQILDKKHRQMLLCSPTGRAAKRMSEATGREAKTIHRLLEFSPKDGRFKRDQHRPLEADLVIVDEASMIDIVLMNSLLKAIPPAAGLILVGDVDQLPSVGPGAVLRDIIASSLIPVIRLSEIFRQARESQIVVNAHRINRGELPFCADWEAQERGDCYLLVKQGALEIQAAILELASSGLPTRHRVDPLEQLQILTPMQKGPIGAMQLNQALQALLNPSGPELLRAGRLYRLGDRVMQIRNNYEKDVYNGDIGRIVKLDLEDREVTVRFDDRQVTYDFNELDELVLAYAVTVHKSQGSEYPVVIIPIHTAHYVMLQRNLLYTAVTRGKRLAVLVGTKKALAIAVKNQKIQQRYTGLIARLQGSSQESALSLALSE